MKAFIFRILIVLGILMGAHEASYAYIDVPSTSYSLEVGVDKYLSVPPASEGYIDHAVWACSKSEIVFKEKDAAGAIIQISRAFSGTAIVELVAVEKYLDSFGRTRALTYYKQYVISCIGGGSVEVSDIILPETINLKIGETKHFKILSGNCYNGAFSAKWKEYEPANYVSCRVNWNTGDIEISGAMAGKGILTISTTNGKTKDCSIVVSASEVVTNRRTEKKAVADIKTLVSNILPIAQYSGSSGVEDVKIDANELNVPKNIYNLNGVLIKQNATDEDIRNLPPGLYIFGRRKILVE